MAMKRHARSHAVCCMLFALTACLAPLRAGNRYGLPAHGDDARCRQLAESWFASPEGRAAFPPLPSGLSYDDYGRVLGCDGETGSKIRAAGPPDCDGRGDWFLRHWDGCRAWVRRRLGPNGDGKGEPAPEPPSSTDVDLPAESRDKGGPLGEGSPSTVSGDPRAEEIPVDVFGSSSSPPPPDPMAPSTDAPDGATPLPSDAPTAGPATVANPPAPTENFPPVNGSYAPRDGETWFDPMGANDWGGRKAFIERYGSYGQSSMVEALVAKFVEVCPQPGQRSGFTFDSACGYYEILNAMVQGGYCFDDGRLGWEPLQAFVNDGNPHMQAGREIGIKRRE